MRRSALPSTDRLPAAPPRHVQQWQVGGLAPFDAGARQYGGLEQSKPAGGYTTTVGFDSKTFVRSLHMPHAPQLDLLPNMPGPLLRRMQPIIADPCRRMWG